MKRRAWAIDVVATCDFMTVSTQRSYGEITNIRRGVAVAVDNLRMHVGSLEQKFGEAKAWVGDVVQEHAGVVEHCEATLSRLDSLPAQGDFLPFLEVTSSTPDGSRLPRSTQEVATLKGFVSVEDVQKAASLGHNVAQQFRSRLSELGVIVQRIFSDSQNLASSVDKDVTRPVGDGDEVGQLMSDVELVARKISTDYEHVLGLQSSPKAVSQASKMALSHTRNYLPALRDRSMDISQHLRAAAEEKNTSATSAVGNMQTISAIESMLANVHQQLSTLALSPENTKAFEVLDFVEHLPAVYSALLVESVRRREWREKMTVDSSTLAEEMAMYKEEETRRRKKWLKGMHNHLNLDVADTTSLAIEVNLQGEENEWPYVTRDTLSKFFEKLKAAGGMEDAAKSLSQMLKDLDAPTRQQTRRANAFKNGSVYDAGFGRSSLLLRGDDDVLRALKDDKSRLEDRLKSSDSRVRKLEDLLHRQSQSNRTSNGSDFHLAGPHGLEQPSSTINQPSSAFATRPQGIPSRKSSVSSRRYSSNQGPEDRTLVQRIVSLEADLASEKEQSATLRNEVFARNNSDHEHKQQMEEIVSTKRDLLDNLEAQQREFDDERRLLEDDTSKLKLRLEELEDELDRVLGSRDNEKLGTDEKVSTLERELGQLRKDAAEEAQKAQGQIDYLRQDYTMQREKANKLEKQKQLNDGETRRLQERIQLLEGRLRAHDDSRRDHQAALHMAHHSLSPDGAIPDGFTALVESIEYLAQRSSTKTKDLEQTMSIIRADNELLTTRLQDVEAELLSTREKLGTKETETISLGESLAEEKAKYNALMAELEDERLQLNTLRIKFAVGETGSGTLKDRIAEEESKVTDLSEELASTKSIVHSLEKELSAAQGKLKEAQTDQSSTYARLETRGVRAKEIMQKLHTYTECINGLLEYLGYSVTSENGSTTIQRVPRTLGASTTLVDPASSMNRTLSGPLPTRHSSETPPDLDLLYWMHCEDPNIEAEKFAAFLDKTGRFDVDAFSEAIIKRVKETEHMARKWQKEARAYRDKSHRAQSEAHEKIAFRSFKEGDLALFLPTRNQATRPWAAFNVGAPHYFLREQDSHKLRTRDWLLARISKVEERVVDLSKSINGLNNQAGNDIDGRSIGEANSDGGASVDDENPFELSDGLRWYLLDAAEEKPGAPTTPGLAKTTVASAHVDVKGSIRTMKKSTNGNGGASKTLSKSLDSRRSSTASRKGVSPSATCLPSNGGGGSGEPSRTNTATSAAPPDTPRTPAAAAVVLAPKEAEDKNPTRTDTDEVRKDLLWGP
ncbi:oligomeric, coiled-coil, peripheral membrane protein [Acarospora aff. strigata]|nr:oligomeric, coiled-coil, peripheral membrane protein [Acarospora aff. strigata]